MYKAILKILIGLILFSFIGIKYDDEFYEPDFFVKHMPNLTLNYYSEIGQSDLKLNDLRGHAKSRHLRYKEFVETPHVTNWLDKYVVLFIPCICMLVIIGILELLGWITTRFTWLNLLFVYLTTVCVFFITLFLDRAFRFPLYVTLILFCVFTTWSTYKIFNRKNYSF